LCRGNPGFFVRGFPDRSEIMPTKDRIWEMEYRLLRTNREIQVSGEQKFRHSVILSIWQLNIPTVVIPAQAGIQI
jgi:hypothetical protein